MMISTNVLPLIMIPVYHIIIKEVSYDRKF